MATESNKRRRRKMRQYAFDLFTQLGIDFESKNYGAHFIVKSGKITIDYWPGTGKYIERGVQPLEKRKHTGIDNLLKKLGI